MAKKSKIARYRSKRKRRANPAKGAAIETATKVGAGFAGYATTRLLSRMAYSQAVKRFPNASDHVHVAVSALGAAGVYFGSKHWSKIEEHHEAASIGAGIALIQTVLQTYIPKFGWVVADVNASQYGAGKKARRTLPDASLSQILPAADETAALPEASDGLGDGFDLDALLAGDDSIEAVQIGQAPPVPEFNQDAFDDFGDDVLEHYNGMLQ